MAKKKPTAHPRAIIEDYEKVFEFESPQAVKLGEVFVNLLHWEYSKKDK